MLPPIIGGQLKGLDSLIVTPQTHWQQGPTTLQQIGYGGRHHRRGTLGPPLPPPRRCPSTAACAGALPDPRSALSDRADRGPGGIGSSRLREVTTAPRAMQSDRGGVGTGEAPPRLASARGLAAPGLAPYESSGSRRRGGKGLAVRVRRRETCGKALGGLSLKVEGFPQFSVHRAQRCQRNRLCFRPRASVPDAIRSALKV